MKNIFFPQQKKLNCNYLPLRWGLKQYTDEQVEALASAFKKDATDNPKNRYCPKIYTTRTKPLNGIYRVVEGDRFHPTPVKGPIIFKVDGTITMTLDLFTELIHYDGKWASGQINSSTCYWGLDHDGEWASGRGLDRKPWTFPELDLGIIGASFGDLRAEILRSYPKADLDTPFYISKLLPANSKQEV